ncbi:MAG: hypothetical protein GY869_02925, partial [Planctomycetes bacterium]|nr:hypothetical protein [Planctomycetota bacterium]
MNEFLDGKIRLTPLRVWMVEDIKFFDEPTIAYLEQVISLPNNRMYAAVRNDRIIAVGGLTRHAYVYGEWGVWLS